VNAEEWLRDKLVEAERLFPDVGFAFALAHDMGANTAFMMASNIPHEELVHLLGEYIENLSEPISEKSVAN
jgi:hypothetical protein